jgi:hypothetical protein
MPSSEFRRLISAGVAILALAFWAVIMILGVIHSYNEHSSAFLTSEGLRYVMPGLTALVGGVLAAVFALPVPTVQRLGNLLTADGPRKQKTNLKALIAGSYVIVYLVLGLLALATWIATGAHTVEFVRTVAAAAGGSLIAIATGYFN